MSKLGLRHHKEPVAPMPGVGSIGMEREALADQGAKPIASGRGFVEFRHDRTHMEFVTMSKRSLREIARARISRMSGLVTAT